MSNTDNLTHSKIFLANKLQLNNEKEQSFIEENESYLYFKDKYLQNYINPDGNNFSELLTNISLKTLIDNKIIFENKDDFENSPVGVLYENGKLIFKDHNISKLEEIYNCVYSGSDRVSLLDLVKDLELFSIYKRIPNFGLVYDFQYKKMDFSNYKYANFFNCFSGELDFGYFSIDKVINDEYTIKKYQNYLFLKAQESGGTTSVAPYSGWLDGLEYRLFGWIDIDKLAFLNAQNEFLADQSQTLSIVTKKFLDRKKSLVYLILNYVNGIWQLNSNNKIFETGFRIVDKSSQMQLDIIGLKNGLRKIISQSLKLGYVGDLLNPNNPTNVAGLNVDLCDLACKKVYVNKCDGTLYEKNCNDIQTTDGTLEDKIVGKSHLISPQIKIHTRNDLRVLFPDLLNTIDPIHWTTGNMKNVRSESVVKLLNDLKNKFGGSNYEVSNLNQNRAFHYADGTFFKGFTTGGYYHNKILGDTYQWGCADVDEVWNGIAWSIAQSSPIARRGLGIGGGKSSLFIHGWGSRPIWSTRISLNNYDIFSNPQLFDNNSKFYKLDLYNLQTLLDQQDQNNNSGGSGESGGSGGSGESGGSGGSGESGGSGGSGESGG
ncbi:MAG: hypothetical protein NZZ41_06455, partial [Candidatus Dojkabacteria bacterium]|nr:hypothetical protein [Candidatus Dojkabacteria bacterium]